MARVASRVPVHQLGERAEAALARAGGRGRIIARLRASTWLDVDGDIVWLGCRGSAFHPRAMLSDDVDVGESSAVDVDASGAAIWRPPSLRLDEAARSRLVDAAVGLRRALDRLGAIDGFGHLLAGEGAPRGVQRVMAMALDRAAPRVRDLAGACAADRANDAADAAISLVGLGPGLTPSGDDFVGGVFFARRLVRDTDDWHARGWGEAVQRVSRAARERTHPISAALLGDLLEGQSHASLHELAAACSAGREPFASGRALVALGHSSGWDILAGFLVGLSPHV